MATTSSKLSESSVGNVASNHVRSQRPIKKMRTHEPYCVGHSPDASTVTSLFAMRAVHAGSVVEFSANGVERHYLAA